MSNLTQKLETLVRAGKLQQARQLLHRLQPRKIPREDAATLANVARRVRLGSLSLRILNPIVRPERRGAVPASTLEVIEYAASLRDLGAEAEAIKLLEGINTSKHPQAAFQLALCWISQWQYEAAIPLLRSYIARFRAQDYAGTVGKLNLLDALIRESQTEEARALLREVRREFDPGKSPLIHRKWLELAAQLEIAEERWDHAIARLEDASAGLDEAQNPVLALFIAKWISIARSQKLGRPIPQLRTARAKAIELGNWETVRDCDFHRARILHDTDTLLRVYFGTPYESYRRTVTEFLGGRANLPERFFWAGDLKPDRTVAFDLSAAMAVGVKAELAPGQAIHRLLIGLSRDFYRPVAPLRLFTLLFPDEPYNPESSPFRVRQVIVRFRDWTCEHRLSLGIEHDRKTGGYRLKFSDSRPVVIPRDPLPLDSTELKFIAFIESLGSDRKYFTIQEAMSALEMSRSSAQRLLTWAISRKIVVREGHTHRARYKRLA